MVETEKKSNRRAMTGVVVSDSNDKTIVVRVETLVKHPLFKKYIRRRKKFMAHDPENECGVGDKVQIIEHRPISKRKTWHLVKVLEKAV
jgi:small subunit ribosomal protein S17